jgi:hypothetical protein
MSIFLDSVIYVLLAILAMQNHLFLAFLLVLVFTFRRGALALVPLAFAIDAYFGAFQSVPSFTLFMIAWYTMSEFVRPQLLMQYKSYGETA